MIGMSGIFLGVLFLMRNHDIMLIKEFQKRLLTINGCRLVGCFIAIVGLAACGNTQKDAGNAADLNRRDTVSNGAGIADTGIYKVYQQIKVSGDQSMTIELLQDSRLSGLLADMKYYPAIHAAELRFNSDDELFDPDGSAIAFKPALLQIRDKEGVVSRTIALGVPCARIDTAYIDEARTKSVYLLTRDYSTGMGSYNGPFTQFVRFTDTGVYSYNGNSGFASSLKSAWVIRYINGGLEVCSKICRPGNTEQELVTNGRSIWGVDSFKVTTTMKNGFWEDEREEGEDGVKAFLEEF